MSNLTRVSIALASVSLASILSACGGGGGGGGAAALPGDVSSTPITAYNPYNPAIDIKTCVPGNDVIGAWKVVANNLTLMPNSPQLAFFSYNQPSVNGDGLVVFRGRAKNATSGSGEIQRGLYATDTCLPHISIYTIADTVNTLVPAPNNTNATFNEFPSIPRIDAGSGLIASRGQSAPVWTYTDSSGASTTVGTSGLYVNLPTGLTTGIGILGNVPEFAYMQVPDASTTGIKFDQFPGSPSASDNKYLVFKGNYTDVASKTGVYYRDLSTAGSPVIAVADSNTVIPGSTNIMFGSTAPPSAANGNVVFLGLDNEQAPTKGGIYEAPIAHKPVLTPLVQIGDAVPKNLDPALTSTFTQIGEGLAFDGRYVAFWGAWGTSPSNAANGQPPGTGMHRITLPCPTDGNKGLQAACQAGSDKDSNGNPTGNTAQDIPDYQGIFVVDTITKTILMVAKADFTNTAGAFNGFTYWTYSGSTQPGDAEPPHWRSSAFAAVDGNRGVIFKGSPNSTSSTGISGIYGATFSGSTVSPLFKVIATGDLMTTLDPSAPAASPITSVSIEREGLRNGWLALTASSADWAGTYVSYFPTIFHRGPVLPDQPSIYSLILGN